MQSRFQRFLRLLLTGYQCLPEPWRQFTRRSGSSKSSSILNEPGNGPSDPSENPTIIGPNGLALIKQFEGLKLTAYHDIAGVPTIGYGHTGIDVTHEDVRNGLTITEREAETILLNDINRFERCVSAAVKQKITQNQFDAMVSLAYNVGCIGFSNSTVLRKLNAGDDHAAANAFLLWNKATIDGKLTEVPGLTRRRKAERELFLRRD